MSKQVIIVHGSNGSPEENWSPYLKLHLASEAIHTTALQLPIGENQNLQSWKRSFNQHISQIDPETILIGHSLGCAFILSILSDKEIKVNSIILVSPFNHLLDIKEFDEVIDTFVEQDFNWQNLKTKYKTGYIFHGDNDPYVPLWMAQEIAEKLEIPIKVIANGGHLNTEAGYKEFPELLEVLNRYLQS